MQLLSIKDKTLEENEENVKIDRYKNDSDMMEKSIKQYANGLQVLFPEGNEILEKYEKGEFILAYFNATRNVKIDIPTNVPKLQLKEKYSIEENIGKWSDNFQNALRILFEDKSIELKFDYKNLNFIINQEGRESYGFDMLSDGYSAVLDIIVNLMLIMEKHHVLSYSIEGIVLIDELESHLHIGLQKSILPFLTKFFPNIQFIISTHLPFIINSIDNVVIYDSEKKQRVEDLSGIAYEGIVEGYFDVNQYSKSIKTKLERYNKLVEKENKSEEEEEEYQLRRYLKDISSELAPEVILTFK